MSNEILELFEAWLKEHDAKVRKQTLLEAAEWFEQNFSIVILKNNSLLNIKVASDLRKMAKGEMK